jgi:response regulator RpfG family c-di-GMP phosphodiesterase
MIEKLLEKTQNLNVLYVEDEAITSRIVIASLSKIFNSVTSAKDGKKAIKAYQDDKYDFVILDIKIPFIDGIEVGKYIKSINPEQDIMYLTIVDSVEKIREAINLGAVDYVLKPFRQEEFYSKLYNHFCKE